MTTIELYHGGHEPIIAPNSRGLFCSAGSEVAESHGPVVSMFEIDKRDVLTSFVLNHQITTEQVELIESILRDECAPGADLERAWEIVVADKGCEIRSPDDGGDEDIALFRACDYAAAGWEAQRIRGRIALALGYKAVEMVDEHGGSYLLVRV